MPTSLRKISEQVAREYARRSGRQVTKELDKVEIRNYVIQAVNKILGLVPKDPDHDRRIPACVIATYKNVTVSSDDGYYCTLPAQPIVLPRDQGVWSVGPDDEASERFIPISAQDWEIFLAMNEGNIEGFTGFYREGGTIRFTSNPSTPVRVRLLVADPAVIGLDDVLPIGADQEIDVVMAALEIMVQSGVSEI